MQHFRIYPEGYHEPDPAPHMYVVGTHISFTEIAGKIKAAIQIPVTIIT